MAASGVRHFPGQTDEPINWKDWQYTFNTAVLWVPRQPGYHQLRSENRYVPHQMG